jgi:predicted AAA+ superfamily ATPase
VSGPTVTRYVDLLVDLGLVRRLDPWHVNIGKRVTRSPKIHVRDSGLVHALLDIPDLHALLGHPVVGASYESFAVERPDPVSRLPPGLR